MNNIAPFEPGGAATVFSAARMNELVEVCNALLNAKVVEGGCNAVLFGPGGVVIQVKRSQPATSATPTTDSIRYRGDFIAGTTYAVGDIVRVTAGTAAGLWIAYSDPGAYVPEWPEPTGARWHLWSFAPKIMSYSTGGVSKKVYVNSSDPYNLP